ncbi:hypothetical protein D6764_03715 [Candidatus Woesearchaeota archaeon]|nr:MAG: hypothetical protein D6764_03715 [Candidatus Woesearchaeota archaeon]
MAECRKCRSRNALTETAGGGFCSKCFKEVIELRLKSSLKKAVPKKGELSFIVLDSLSENFLKRVKFRPFKLEFHNFPDVTNRWSWRIPFSPEFASGFSGDYYVVLPWTAEDSAEVLLESLSSQKAFRLPSSFIALWKDVSEEEAALYASLLGIPWRKALPRRNLSFWKPLMENDSSLLFGFQKSAEELIPLIHDLSVKPDEV